VSDPEPIDKLDYEAARNQLVEVVQRLEAGTPTLKEAMDLWERGEALAARCQEWLDGAKARIAAKRESLQEGTVAKGTEDTQE
jgi:exodeoxyribonuclease VII small subunit